MNKWSVLVAEDEPVILSGLCKFIESSRGSYEIVARCDNGEDAIRCMQEYRPDIVVSDIQMPKATGLDMIRAAREGKLDIQFVFISGYQEFSYAQEALRYNAVDYLLKPVGREDLERALQKAVTKMSERSAIKNLREEKSSVQTFFEELHPGNTFTENKSREEFLNLHLNLEDGCCLQGFSVFIAPTGTPGTGSSQTELLRFVLYDKIGQYIEKEKRGFVAIKNDDGCCLILYARNLTILAQLGREFLGWLKQLETEYHVSLQVGVGQTVTGTENLIAAYKTTRFSQELHYFEPDRNPIFYDQVQNHYEGSFEEYQTALDEVINALVFHDKHYKECLEALFQSILHMHYGNQKAADYRMQLLLEEVASQLIAYNLITEEDRLLKEEYSKKLSSAKNFEEACHICRVCIGKYYDRSAAALSSSEGVEIVKVKKYIREHYTEDISLNTLADMVSMNPSYLSALFKRNTGQNYIKYLTDVRMDAAYKLLTGTDMMTYEIAEAVGYHTVRRFVESFKKKFGMSPLEYKKKKP